MRLFLAWLILAALSLAPALANDISAGSPSAPIYRGKAFANKVDSVRIRVGSPSVFLGGYSGLDAPLVGVKDAGGQLWAISGQQAVWEKAVPDWATFQGFYGATGTNQIIINQPGPYNPATPTSNCYNVFKSDWTGIIGGSYVSTAPGGYANDQCGNWPVSALKVGATYNLFVHEEGPADYHAASSTTDKSLALFTSASASGPWVPFSVAGVSNGTIISSDVVPVANQLLGIGDCTTVPDGTALYVYAYCMYYTPSIKSNYYTVVARAPVSNLAPGQWKMLYKGVFQAPALNNHYDASTGLPQADLQLPVGNRCATMPRLFNVMCLAEDHAIYQSPVGQQGINGIVTAVSDNFAGPFRWIPPPLIPYDVQDFRTSTTADPRKTDLLLYAALRNISDGSSVLSYGAANLTFVWIPPNNGFICRYQIVQPATFTPQLQTAAVSGIPASAVQLTLWSNAGGDANSKPARLRASTFNPMAPMYIKPDDSCDALETHWSISSGLGFLATACPYSLNVNKCDANALRYINAIEGCYNPATDDYLLQINTNTANPLAHSCPVSFQSVLRTEGYVYKSARGDTKPLMSCMTTATGYHWASNDPACGGQTVVGLLGYILAQ